MKRRLVAVVTREQGGYVALCPDLDVDSQGETAEEARANLEEAVQLLFDSAEASELESRLHLDVLVTDIEVQVP